MHEWKLIDPSGEFEAEGYENFLIIDDDEFMSIADSAREYYQAKYWLPVPKRPNPPEME